MERMLQKGDKLSSEYKDFNFESLDAQQKFWIERLSIFSKYRNLVVSRYNGTYISTDIKIMFLDQHSMKIGSGVFYTLEHSRMRHLEALENFAGYASIAGGLFFFRFAYKAPMHHKLYKELTFAAILGLGVAQAKCYYHYLRYVDVVNESYDAVKTKFAQMPDENI